MDTEKPLGGVAVVWEAKTYTAESFEKLLNVLLKDDWFGTLPEFAERIKAMYGVALDQSSPEAMFAQLHKLGELKIVPVKD